jgi:hypothetical protein
MAQHTKFLVTVDDESGEVVKVERMGEAGELTEVDTSSFSAAALAGGGSPYVVNIFIGSSAEPIVTTSAEQAGKGRAKPPACIPAPGCIPSPGPRPKPPGDDDNGDGEDGD